MLREDVKNLIRKNEDLSLKPYPDADGESEGYGRFFPPDGPPPPPSITQEIAEQWLVEDVDKAAEDAARWLERHVHQPGEAARLREAWAGGGGDLLPRMVAAVDMAFNLGAPRLAEFEKMAAAWARRAWEEAAAEALDSRWARQVKLRAKRDAALIRGDYGAVQSVLALRKK